MIAIRDYSRLPRLSGLPVDFGLQPGQAVRVYTAGQVFWGLVVGEEADTLTLAVSDSRRAAPDCLVLAKAHIAAVARL